MTCDKSKFGGGESKALSMNEYDTSEFVPSHIALAPQGPRAHGFDKSHGQNRQLMVKFCGLR